MARTVRFTATDPIKIDPSSWPRDESGNLRPISICACGVSRKFPICDGMHKACRLEEPGHEYRYDPASGAVIEKRPSP